MLDDRSRALSGEASWIRSNIEVFSRPGNLTSHDWIQLMQSAGSYLMADIFDDDDKNDAVMGLVDACQICLTAVSCHTSENRDRIQQIKLSVVEKLCKAEAVLPRTEMAVLLHSLVHVPDIVYKWNSVRNFWSFFGER